MKQTRWQLFAEKMSGLTTPEITKYIEKSRKEARENFEIRDLKFKDKNSKEDSNRRIFLNNKKD